MLRETLDLPRALQRDAGERRLAEIKRIGAGRAQQPVGAEARVLARVEKPDATSIALADVTQLTKGFGSARFNGDGVIPPDSATDPDTSPVELGVKFRSDVNGTITGILNKNVLDTTRVKVPFGVAQADDAGRGQGVLERVARELRVPP